ncbi:hypothetical protein Lalb_Chr16g0382821 [Lupinus albus]|uniref:Transmembrane protein n=1 Tax=Lupinus albus TaxID=3870 RepID=A0A6A4PCS0_LUPAL|nr:hypothetical protein Lalb_Chr16g0382821 [Lupinus albus]
MPSFLRKNITMEVERMVQLMLLFWRKPSSCVALVGENHTAARFSTRLKFNLFALLVFLFLLLAIIFTFQHLGQLSFYSSSLKLSFAII